MMYFQVPGEPVAKARPRVYRLNGFVRTVTPQSTVNYENHVKTSAAIAGVRMMTGPVAVFLQFVFPLPISRYKKRAPRPREWRTSKPDCDNLVKAVLDALNGIAWHDDSQVVKLVVEKITGGQGEAPACHVSIDEAAQCG